MGNMFPVKARASRSAKTKAMLAPPDPLNAPVKAEPEESRWENYMPGIAVVSSEPAFLHCFGASDRRISYAWLLLRKVDVAAKSALWETTARSTIRSGQPWRRKKICDAVSKVFSKAVESWRHHLQDLVLFLFGN